MNKRIVILLMFVGAAGYAADDYEPVGLKYRIGDKDTDVMTQRTTSILGGVWFLGHLGFNIMSAYFQMGQAAELQEIPYPDNEVGVAEEDKVCGLICRENSAAMRNNAKHATNLNYLATLTSAGSALFNTIAFMMWAAMQANWDRHEEYEGNINKFSRIAMGISAVNALLNIISTSVTIDSAIYYIDELPIQTTSRYQVAAFTGAGYWLPMVLFGGYGFVSVAEYIESARVGLGWLYAQGLKSALEADEPRAPPPTPNRILVGDRD